MVYRRGNSPGYARSRSPRSRSGSPYSRRAYSPSPSPARPPPGYRARDRDRSPLPYRDRSRSRSRSSGRDSLPPPARGGADGSGWYSNAGGGLRGVPRDQPARGRSPGYSSRRYSRSRSRSGPPGRGRGSRSRSSSQEPGQIPAGHRRPQQIKQPRSSAAGAAAASDLTAQLQSLRQQLDAEKAARAAAEVRVEFLKGKVRDVAERSKQRGNMLAQLALAARRVRDAQQELQAAEGDLQEVLRAAEDYLQDDAPAPPVAARPAAADSPAPPSGHEEQQTQQQQQQQQQTQDTEANGQAGNHSAVAADEETAAPAAAAEGGWVEAGPAQGMLSAPNPAPLQNIKFKLRL